MRIVMVAAECEPFAKTGGLADVVDALSRALGRLGHEVDVFLPLYRGIIPPSGADATALTVLMPIGGSAAVTVRTAEADGYRIRLVDHPASFDRAGFYGEHGADYPDNGARFTLLGRTALAALVADGRSVDIIHGHDWHAGPVLLTLAARVGEAAWAGVAGRAGTMLTCHNLAYHGSVSADRVAELGVTRDPGFAMGLDLLREAIRAAGIVNTVSPTYAVESRTPEYGAGLDAVLRGRGDEYLGIMNGIDPDVWDPATDAALPSHYSLIDPDGKIACKADLCERLGLDKEGPLFGMIGRLDPMKGFDLVAAAAPAMLDDGARLVVLGTGDESLVADLRALAVTRPDRIAVIERFDRDEARRIYAASDAFLMPSRFEPSGQGQLIALRYGSVPLVRRTGGLADSIFDIDRDTERGNGYVFDDPRPGDLVAASRRLVDRYADPAAWRDLMRRGMAEDHGWEQPAREYVAAYERTVTASS
ncbi:MAG: glycogen/starch synthase [Candidatus Limnocylindrales bacterium]